MTPIDSYIQSLNLEFDAESIYYDSFQIFGRSQRIPRVLSLLKYIRGRESLIDACFPIAFIFVYYLSFPAIFVFKSINAIKSWFVIKRVHLEVDSGSLYLALSNSENLKYAEEKERPHLIITTPFRGVLDPTFLDKISSVNIYEIHTLHDVIWAFFQSIKALNELQKSKNRKLMLWAYTAFEWFITYKVLLRLEPKEIWISNHYDRWTLLATSIETGSVTLVQHGRLQHIFPDTDNELVYRRAKKLVGISRIYALDERSRELFCEYIDCSNVVFKTLNKKIGLIDWPGGYEFKGGDKFHKILIIGGSGDISFYERLIKTLLSEFVSLNVSIAIRHHPLQKHRIPISSREFANVIQLEPSDALPLPDIVVSYGSSLDDQLKVLPSVKLVNYMWSSNANFVAIARKVREAL